MRRRALTAALGLLLAGCHSTFISAKDYDQSCTTSADCVVVTDGDACGVCGCGNAAVNVKAAARLNGDKNAIACVRLGQVGVSCGACAQTIVDCSNGTCGVRTQ